MPQHPFEVGIDYLASHIDDMVDVTFADIQSQFLIMPRGQNFIEFWVFQDAYEALKQETDALARFNDETVWKALEAQRTRLRGRPNHTRRLASGVG